MLTALIINSIDISIKVAWYITKSLGWKIYYMKYGYPITDHDRIVMIANECKDMKEKLNQLTD